MDWIPSDEITGWISKKLRIEETCDDDTACEEEEAVDRRRSLEKDVTASKSKTKTVRFGKVNLIRNMGIMFVIALGIIIFYVLFRLAKCLAYSDYKYYRIYMTISEAIHYNLFIRYILQSTLKL